MQSSYTFAKWHKRIFKLIKTNRFWAGWWNCSFSLQLLVLNFVFEFKTNVAFSSYKIFPYEVSFLSPTNLIEAGKQKSSQRCRCGLRIDWWIKRNKFQTTSFLYLEAPWELSACELYLYGLWKGENEKQTYNNSFDQGWTNLIFKLVSVLMCVFFSI